MDRFEIRDLPADSRTGSEHPISIEINDSRLQDLMKQELDGDIRSGNVEIAPEDARLPSRHLLDKPIPDLSVDGRTAVLVCPECGDLGCGSVLVRVTIEPDRVIWSDFLLGVNYYADEPGDLDRTLRGRFEFDREAYESQLRPPG